MNDRDDIVSSTVDEAAKTFLDHMGSRTVTTIFRLFLSLTIGALCYWGPELVNSQISKSPDVAQNKKAMEETRVALGEVKSTLDSVSINEKAISDQQSRIIASLKEQNEDRQAVKTSIAVLTEHVAGVEKQLDRVENNQGQDERRIQDGERR